MRWHCKILGKWTTIVGSKTWAGFATNLWTCYPRQAWPPGSLTMKHYQVQEEPSTRISKSLHKSGLALMKELLLLEQISQWLGVLGYTYGMKVASLQTTQYFARMHDWFGVIPKEAKQTFSNSWRQLSPNTRGSEVVTSFIRTYASWTEHEDNAYISFQH